MEELLGKVVKKCIDITENTKADVFFEYHGQIKRMSIYVCENGFNSTKENIFEEISFLKEINQENLKKALTKLEELEKELEKNK